MNFKNLSIVTLLLFFCFSCAKDFDQRPETQSDHTLSGPPPTETLIILTPGNAVAIGETMTGYLDLTYSRVPDGIRSGREDCDIEQKLHLFKDGVFVRVVDEAQVTWRLGHRFTWTVPSSQATGGNYQLQQFTYSSCAQPTNLGLKSEPFTIIGGQCALGAPLELETTYEQNETLFYNIPTYSYDSQRFLTVKVFKGQTLKYQLGPVNHSAASPGLQNILGYVILYTATYPAGTDYRIVFELACAGDVQTLERTFSVIPSTSGGGIANVEP